MKKYLYPLGLAIIIIVVVAFVVNRGSKVVPVTKTASSPKASTSKKPTQTSSPINMSYNLDGAVSDSEVFGEPVYGDIGMGKDSVIMFRVQETSGTGIFVYVVAAYKVDGVYKGTKGFFIGDRISPQNIRIVNRVIEVNYATRKASDPMTEAPSVGVTKYLVLKDGELQEK